MYNALALALDVAEPLQYPTQLASRRCFKRREVLLAKRTELQLLASRRWRKPDAWNSSNHRFDCGRRANCEYNVGILDVVREWDMVWIGNVTRLKPIKDLPALRTCAWMQPHSQAQSARAMKRVA
jgi:hypothetical protein